MPADEATGEEARRRQIGNGLLIGLAVAALLLVALDFVYERHPYFAIEGGTGFYALCGAGACALGIAVARVLGSVATLPEDNDDRQRRHSPGGR